MAGRRKKNLKLDTPEDVRKSLSKLANMILNDEIDTKKANAIVYISNGILQSIRVDEQEKRIEELEAYINDKQ